MRAIAPFAYYLIVAATDQILVQHGIDVGQERNKKGAGRAAALKRVPAPAPPAQHWGGYLGCFKDSHDRDVPNHMPGTYSRDACLNKCGELGYPIAALQYMYHCFCGNQYGYYGALPPQRCDGSGDPGTSGTRCKYGDTTVDCGGAFVNSVYAVPKLLGCYVDTAVRDLKYMQGDQITRDKFDRDSCHSTCRDLRYRYAGVQHETYCFCDNTYGGYGQAPDADCAKFGPGHGGAWRNSVYELNPYTSKIDMAKGASSCFGISTEDVPLPPMLKKKFKINAAFKICWGPSFGTRIVVNLDSPISPYSITGQIIWPKSWIEGTFSLQTNPITWPFIRSDNDVCFYCPNNRPAGFITICRAFGSFSLSLPTFGGVWAFKMDARLCFGIGVSFAGGGELMDFSIEISAGPAVSVKAPTWKAAGSALLSGTCTLKDVRFIKKMPFMTWNRTIFTARYDGSASRTVKGAQIVILQYRGVLSEYGEFTLDDWTVIDEPLLVDGADCSDRAFDVFTGCTSGIHCVAGVFANSRCASKMCAFPYNGGRLSRRRVFKCCSKDKWSTWPGGIYCDSSAAVASAWR